MGMGGAMAAITSPLNLLPRGVDDGTMDLDLHGGKTPITDLIGEAGIAPPTDSFDYIENFEGIPDHLIKAGSKVSLEDMAGVLNLSSQELRTALKLENGSKIKTTKEVEGVMEALHTHDDYGQILVDSFLKGKSDSFKAGEGLAREDVLTILQGLKLQLPEVKPIETRSDIINNWVQRDADQFNLDLNPEESSSFSQQVETRKRAKKVAPKSMEVNEEQPVPVFQKTLYQGKGKTAEEIYGKEAVEQGRAVPLFGKGEYFTFSKADAQAYGKVSAIDVELKNPFILDSDLKWFELLRNAETPHLNNMDRLFYTEPHKIPEATQKLQLFLKNSGYDGIIIDLDSGQSVRRLQAMVGVPQVVKFPKQSKVKQSLELNEEQYVKLAGEHLIAYGKKRGVMNRDLKARIVQNTSYGGLKAAWNSLDRHVNEKHIESLEKRNEAVFKKVKDSNKMNEDYRQAILGAKKGLKTGYVEMSEALGKETGMAGELYRLFKNSKELLEDASLEDKVLINQHINTVLTLAQGIGVDSFMRKQTFEDNYIKKSLAVIAEDRQKMKTKPWKGGLILEKYIMPTMPVQIAIDFMDGMQDGFGALSKIVRTPINIAHNANLKMRDNYMTPLQNLIKKYRKELTDISMQRIYWQSLKDQKDDAGQDLSYKSESLTPEISDGLKLTSAETLVYKEMRRIYDELRPLIKRYTIDVLGKEWNPRDDYMHLLIDWEAMQSIPMQEKFTNSPFLNEAPDEIVIKSKEMYDPNFTKKLTKKEKVMLKEDALEAISNYIKTASHVLNMSKDINMLKRLSDSKQFGEIVGEVKQGYIRDWLEAVDTDGHGKEIIPYMDLLRRNTSAGALGFKLSSMVVQATALADASALLGGRNVMRNFKKVLLSEDLRNQLRESFPEFKDRMHDWGFAELATHPKLARLQKLGYEGLRQVDSIVAAATLLTSYEQWCEQAGIEMDLKNPHPVGLLKAQEMMQRTQGSSFVKDLPLAITTGKGLAENQSINKALLHFQTFTGSRFYSMMIYEMAAKGFVAKDRAHGVRVASYLLLADALDISLRGLAVGALYALIGGENYEPEYTKEFARNLYGIVPVLGGAINSLLWDRPLLPLETTWEELKGVVSAQDPKLKALHGMGVVGMGVGIPGTSQLQQIIKARRRKKKREEKEHVPYKGYTIKSLSGQSSLRSTPNVGKWYTKN